MNSIKINNVKSYDINSGVYIEFLNKLICKNVSIQSNINLTKVYSFGDIILVLDEVNKAYILSDTVLIDNIFNFRIGSLKFPFIEYYKKEQPRKYGIYDFSSQKFLFETTEWIGRDIIGDFIFSDYQGQITCRKVISAQPLWQFDLGRLGEYVNIINENHPYEVKFFLGIYNDCLLVQLSNATFIWIDSHTGKQKHILNLNESYSLPSPVFYDDSFKAHIVGEKIVFLNNQRLLHINLDSFEVTIIQDYYTQERAHQYRFFYNTFFEDKIYFVADYGWQYVTPSYVGVMDANSGEILWKQQLENTGGLSEAPQVSEDKLYIRTNNNVLHIFEKE